MMKCERHPTYKAYRHPTCDCETCWEMFKRRTFRPNRVEIPLNFVREKGPLDDPYDDGDPYILKDMGFGFLYPDRTVADIKNIIERISEFSSKKGYSDENVFVGLWANEIYLYSQGLETEEEVEARFEAYKKDAISRRRPPKKTQEEKELEQLKKLKEKYEGTE